MDGRLPARRGRKANADSSPANLLDRLVSDGYLGGFQQGFERGFKQGFREGADDARRTTLLALAAELLDAVTLEQLEALDELDALQAELIAALRPFRRPTPPSAA